MIKNLAMAYLGDFSCTLKVEIKPDGNTGKNAITVILVNSYKEEPK